MVCEIDKLRRILGVEEDLIDLRSESDMAVTTLLRSKHVIVDQLRPLPRLVGGVQQAKVLVRDRETSVDQVAVGFVPAVLDANAGSHLQGTVTNHVFDFVGEQRVKGESLAAILSIVVGVDQVHSALALREASILDNVVHKLKLLRVFVTEIEIAFEPLSPLASFVPTVQQVSASLVWRCDQNRW